MQGITRIDSVFFPRTPTYKTKSIEAKLYHLQEEKLYAKTKTKTLFCFFM